jgi:hypothetical protein
MVDPNEKIIRPSLPIFQKGLQFKIQKKKPLELIRKVG